MGITKKLTGAIAAIALVVMVTMVTFAFTKKSEKSVVDTVYYQTSDGTYVLDPGTSPTGFTCRSISSNPCTLTFQDEEIAENVEEFNISELGDLEQTYGDSEAGEPQKLYLPVIP